MSKSERIRLRGTRNGWQIVPPSRSRVARAALVRQARCLRLGMLRSVRVGPLGATS